MALRMLGSFSTGTPLTEICQRGKHRVSPHPRVPHGTSLPLLLPFPACCAPRDRQIPHADGTPSTQTPSPSCPAGPYPLHGSAEARGDGSRSGQLAEIGGSPHVERLLQVQDGVGHLARRHGETGGDVRPRHGTSLLPPGCIPRHIRPGHRSHLQSPWALRGQPLPRPSWPPVATGHQKATKDHGEKASAAHLAPGEAERG